MKQFISVQTTSDNKQVLSKISEALIDSRLAACCQISGPIRSIYRWKNKIESSNEYLCTIKTSVDYFVQIEAVIRKLHAYDEPEIIYFPIEGGSESYLKWLEEQLN